MDETTEGAAPPPTHAGLTYAALRLVLLAVTGAVLYLLGMRGMLWLMATVLISAALSFFVLLRQREAAARALEASLTARRARRPAEATQAGPAEPAVGQGVDGTTPTPPTSQE